MPAVLSFSGSVPCLSSQQRGRASGFQWRPAALGPSGSGQGGEREVAQRPTVQRLIWHPGMAAAEAESWAGAAQLRWRHYGGPNRCGGKGRAKEPEPARDVQRRPAGR